ncbi:uncharacterized protein Z518_10607 [Rhinocladiella mackenziei CBS 650.93]|uniref:Prenyltransferase alpha-alpha toroid domain-containing protein n=1 Tax=Rhinocladiella mackenziei CBS 650.93 TaxID=1442369 RepID=A0A0D2FEJ4_9EURO|nr:uncharacterized protein Z518_10607 [Rhinocladiella mackenziei CBS 650.93]KIX00467.1 hypothetical protein Z518_10607 [Rhinocladiella mackenziei CBS 650.93]
MTSKADSQVDRERHIKYWRRCAQILPEPYTSGEASRMSFGFFIVAALDLLDAFENVITPAERLSWIEWIYACQVPHTGGFRGFTGTMMGGMRHPGNWHWDPANLPNTYFALATLLILGDDLGRVKRKECLQWVKSLQRPNGSFGEFLGEDDVVEGADDPRLCLCAAGTIKLLQGGEQDEKAEWLDEGKLRQYIANCQSHEGGIGQAPLLEAHSGLNYCAIATLSFLGLLQEPPISIHEVASEAKLDTSSCTRWMLDRQTTRIEGGDEGEHEIDETQPEKFSSDMSRMGHELKITEKVIAGFCGRCGKIADTCYCFWNVGALAILQQHHLVDVESLRGYLLDKAAHLIGGFGKGPGELPDLLHSYLGLAVLAIYNEPGLKEFDATFCFSKDAVQKLKHVAWRQS